MEQVADHFLNGRNDVDPASGQWGGERLYYPIGADMAIIKSPDVVAPLSGPPARLRRDGAVLRHVRGIDVHPEARAGGDLDPAVDDLQG